MKPEEEEELKRRQLEELRQKQQRNETDAKNAQGCGIGCLGLIVVFAVIGWLSNSCSGSSSQSSTGSSTQSSRADERARREVAQKYWSNTIGFMAMAGAAIQFAGESMQSGDSVSAQQFLTMAEKQADRAYDVASNDEPPGDTWTDIQSSLMQAASTYKKAIGEIKDGLANDNSETIASALDDAKSAGDLMTDATHNARVWYEQNGGKWSDVEDYQTAEQSVASNLKSLVNSSGQ